MLGACAPCMVAPWQLAQTSVQTLATSFLGAGACASSSGAGGKRAEADNEAEMRSNMPVDYHGYTDSVYHLPSGS